MKLIPLTKGKFAKVSDKDYPRLRKIKWYCSTLGYAVSNVIGEPGQMLRMHRVIKGCTSNDGLEVDHKDGCRTNNTRGNLRITSDKGTAYNRRKSAGTSSKYKGVSFSKYHNKWNAYIKINGARKFLGYYDNEVEAAKVYNRRAKSLFGKFAYLNNV